MDSEDSAPEMMALYGAEELFDHCAPPLSKEKTKAQLFAE